jgi:protein-tyrosine phosphatase
MDHDNLRSLRRLAGGDEVALSRIGLLLAYDPNLVGLNDGDPLLEVPDPYFGGADGFRDVLTMIERSVDGLMSSYVIPHLGDDRRG